MSSRARSPDNRGGVLLLACVLRRRGGGSNHEAAGGTRGGDHGPPVAVEARHHGGTGRRAGADVGDDVADRQRVRDRTCDAVQVLPGRRIDPARLARTQIAEHLDHLTEVRDEADGTRERLEAVPGAFALISYYSRRHHDNELATLLHRDQQVTQAQQRLQAMIRELLTEGTETGDVRDDIDPDELASYCLHALTAADDCRPNRPCMKASRRTTGRSGTDRARAPLRTEPVPPLRVRRPPHRGGSLSGGTFGTARQPPHYPTPVSAGC